MLYIHKRNYRKAEGRTFNFKHTYNQEKVDNAIYEIVSNLHTMPQFRKAIAAVVGDKPTLESYETEMKGLRKQLHFQEHLKYKLGNELDALDILTDDYDLQYEEMQAKIDETYEQIEEIEHKIEKCRKKMGTLKKGIQGTENVKTLLQSFPRLYQEMNSFERREIIDKDIWDAAQKKRKETGVKWNKTHSLEHEHILSGLLKCPICGTGMAGTVRRRKNKKTGDYKDDFYNRCLHRKKIDEEHFCNFKLSLNQEEINKAVEILPERMESGRILKQIDLRFPIYYEGSEGDQIRLLNELNVETVVVLSKLHEAKHHVNVKLDMDEMDLTAAENFNIPRSEGAKQPQCPKEKEEAIIGALKAFQMI